MTMRLRYKPFALPELHENKLVYFDPKENKGRWKEIFGNDNPIHIEIGAGRGGFIKELALRNPDINYIAVEMDEKIFVYTGRMFLEEEENIQNVRLLKDKAENLAEFFEEDEVDKIYINFSNPWPKKKHHKRRITHPRQLVNYVKILKNGGLVEFKTDDRPFFEDSLDYFEENGFEILDYTFDLTEEYKADNIVTEYERKWRKRDIPINYLKAKLNK